MKWPWTTILAHKAPVWQTTIVYKLRTWTQLAHSDLKHLRSRGSWATKGPHWVLGFNQYILLVLWRGRGHCLGMLYCSHLHHIFVLFQWWLLWILRGLESLWQIFKVPRVWYLETIQPLPDTGTKTLSASTSCWSRHMLHSTCKNHSVKSVQHGISILLRVKFT